LKTATKCYQNLFGEMPLLEATHGGLECGIFGNKLPGVEIIAYGATCNELHTPNEYLSISSTEKVWNFLQSFLKELD
jgi:dipeptidase D